MRGLVLLLIGVCLVFLVECRIQEEVFVPVLIPQLEHKRERRQAPSINVHKIPKTSFSCDGKTSGEYYADTETKCQVYHVCIAGFRGKMSVMSFVCPNGTIFSQASRVCTPFDRVDCALTNRFYDTVHGDPNIHIKDVQGVTAPPKTTVHKEQPRRPTGRQGQARPPPRHTRPATTSTAAPRVTRPQISRGPQAPPRTVIRTSVVSTSTAAYDYDYEYDYEDEDKNDRNKRDADDSLGLLSFDWSRYPIMTGFSCDDKVTGAFYADVETNCEMIHVCVPVAKKKLIDHKLFCSEGKAYNQQTGYCETKGTFDCSSSPKFYKYDKIQSYFVGKPAPVEKKVLKKTTGTLKY